MKAVKKEEPLPEMFNPIDESELKDERNQITENCFVELDIAMKGYKICFGEDAIYESIVIVHSTLAYILGNHQAEHSLANVNIDEFSVPDSPFETKSGLPTDKLYHMVDSDVLHYVANLVMNSKAGINELKNSSYFEGLKPDLILDKETLLFHLLFQYDAAVLQLNSKYSILNFNL